MPIGIVLATYYVTSNCEPVSGCPVILTVQHRTRSRRNDKCSSSASLLIGIKTNHDVTAGLCLLRRAYTETNNIMSSCGSLWTPKTVIPTLEL